jgi:hypothetical protein
MTGLEKTPVLYGGDASLGDAGAFINEAQLPVSPDSLSWLRALAAQAPLFGYLALFAILVVRSMRRRLFVAASMACLAVVSSSLSWLTFRAMPPYVNTLGPIWGNAAAVESPVNLPSNAKLSYRVALSQRFLDILRKEIAPEDRLCFFIGFPGVGGIVDPSGVEVSVTAGPVNIPTQAAGWPFFSALEPQEALAALVKSGHLTVHVTNHTVPTELAAWQRRGLPGRHITLTPVDNPPDQLGTVSAEADGTLDIADGKTIAGWAWDPQKPDRPIKVDIYDGDNKLASVLANTPRGDLVDAGIGNGKHGFYYSIPRRLKDGKSHTFRVMVSGTKRELSNSPKTLELESYRDPNQLKHWQFKHWQCLPAFEIRLIRPDASIKVAGF